MIPNDDSLFGSFQLEVETLVFLDLVVQLFDVILVYVS